MSSGYGKDEILPSFLVFLWGGDVQVPSVRPVFTERPRFAE